MNVHAETIDFDVDVYYENSTLKAYVELNKIGVNGVLIGTLLNDGVTVSTVSVRAEKNAVLKFPQGMQGDCIKVFLWDQFSGMKPLVKSYDTNIKIEDGFVLTTKLNMLQPGTYGYSGQFTVEGDYIYMCRQGIIYKIDISDVNNPKVIAQSNYSKNLSATMATAMAINGDYIYVGNRLAKAAYPTEEEEANLTAGALAVLRKSDLAVVSITPLGQKVSGMSLYENLLVVNLQMLGWSIYDASDAENPILLERIEFPRGKSIETQGGEIFEHEGKVYYAVAGFGDGIRMYDLTQFYEYVQNPDDFDNVPQIGDDELLWFYHFYSHGIGGNHTYDLTVEYPYVYATIAATKSQKENPERVQGILTLDITEISKKPTGHVITNIANEDKNNMTTSADTEPSIICKIGDKIVVNNDDNGIAYFDTSKTPGIPEYVGTYNPYEGSCIFRMMYSKNRLFLTDGSGAKSGVRLYVVEGFIE